MSALNAARLVLEQANEPLHYREIARRALESGHWMSDGATPEATINAQLATHIKRHGTASPFQRTGRGIFALRDWGLPEVAPLGKQPAYEPGPRPSMHVIGPVSFTDAAAYVLDQYSGRQPMHYRAITERVLAEGLVVTQGLTPEATLYAQILTEIKRKEERGETPRFAKHGKGFVGLRKWMRQGLAHQIERHNAEVKRALLADLGKLDPIAFEALVSRLLVALGFEEVAVTKASGDGGIDVRGTLVVGEVVRTRMAVQVKRWKANVQAPVVQQVRGSLGTHEQGLIITTGGFSKGATEEARRKDAIPVGLMDGDQLVALLAEHDIGVRATAYKLLERVPLGDEGDA